MKKLIQWTFFLDILGYGQVQKNIDTKEKADKFVKFMKETKKIVEIQDDIAEKIYKGMKFNLNDYYDFKSVFISDSFVLTAIPKEREFNDSEYYSYSTFVMMELTFRIIELIEFLLREEGLLIRGGISRKFTYISEENSLAIGQGLIEAYTIESSFAEVPRILLSQEISNDTKIMTWFDRQSQPYGNNFSIFCKDTNKDDLYYLDYLGYTLVLLNRGEKMRSDILKEAKEKYSISEETLMGIFNIIKDTNEENFREDLSKYYAKSKFGKEDIKIVEKMLSESYIMSWFQQSEILKSITIKSLDNLIKTIQKNIKKHSENINVLKKYVWLREYLNNSIEKFPHIEFIQKYKII